MPGTVNPRFVIPDVGVAKIQIEGTGLHYAFRDEVEF
jgi:hypothetical protein